MLYLSLCPIIEFDQFVHYIWGLVRGKWARTRDVNHGGSPDTAGRPTPEEAEAVGGKRQTAAKGES